MGCKERREEGGGTVAVADGGLLEERGVYVRLFEEALGECDALQAMYEEALQQWRQGKRDRGVGEGDGAGARVCNCTATHCTG
jgi:hypothetical protein